MAGNPMALASNAGPQSSASVAAPQQPQGGLLTPPELDALLQQLKPTIAAFRENSTRQALRLNPAVYTGPGDQETVEIAEIGLGVRIISEHVVTLQVTNAATTAQACAISPIFPFNLIKEQITINGPPNTTDVDGYGAHLTAFRSRKTAPSSNAEMAGQTIGLPDTLVRMTGIGANLTFTAQVQGAFNAAGVTPGGIAALSGVAPSGNNLSVAASAGAGAASQFTVTFYTLLKLAHSEDAMVGALPLQNDSIYATVQRTLTSALAGSDQMHNVASSNANLTWSVVSARTNSEYEFWTIPEASPQLYAPIVSSSYQILTARSRTFAATGQDALIYPFPKRNYSTAVHVICRDANGAMVVPNTAWTAFRLIYGGGSMKPLEYIIPLYFAKQYWDYSSDMSSLPGYLLWDGQATADEVNASDEAGFLNNYDASNPEFHVDVGSGVAVTATYDIVREAIVSGSVEVAA